MAHDSFELLSRSCVGPDEFFLKAIYVGLSVVALACVCVMLLRVAWKRWRPGGRSSIGRLIEYLVWTQGACDLIYHTVDLVFALDCNAPPLFTLLTAYRDNIYARPTVAYNTAKEGLGFMSLLWHAHVAYCMYSWIVLKVSAIRLRRRRIPALVLFVAGITIGRYYLFWTLRDGLLGLYLSTLLFDGLMVPTTVAMMLRYYCLTMQALREHPKKEVDKDYLQQQPQQQRSGGSIDPSPEPSPLSSQQQQQRPVSGDSDSRPKAPSNSSMVEMPNPFQMPSLASHQAEAGGGSSGLGANSGLGAKLRKKSKNKNMLIIRRLNRISLSVSLIWLLLAAANIATWAHFKLYGDVKKLRWLLMLRLVVLRLIGTVDAIFLGDLFVLCRPCTRSLRRAIARLRLKWEGRAAPLPLPLAHRQGSGGFDSLASQPGHNGGSVDTPTHASAVSLAGGSTGPPLPPQQQPRQSGLFSFFGGRALGAGTPGSFGWSSSSEGSGVRQQRDEWGEEAAAAVRWAEELQRKRAPTRQMRSVEIFASTFNMGGVDRESACGITSGGGTSAGGGGDRDETAAAPPKKSALQLVIPLWIPRGYDLYVIGVQECQILKELRDAILEHLGGREEFTCFGKDIGSEVILHGRIAVSLFVRTADVAQGRFKLHEGVVDRVAAGVSLGPLGQLENKGMTGLSCSYNDATLAIITAHFASDSHGRNKLAKRNAHACTTLRALSLHWENDCDAHLQHHHTIMLGDLNYRCMGTPHDVLGHLQRTAQQLQQADGGNWRALSYARLFEPPTPYRFPLETPPPDLPRCLAVAAAAAATRGPRPPGYPAFGGASSVLSGGGGGSGLLPIQQGTASALAREASSPPRAATSPRVVHYVASPLGKERGRSRSPVRGGPSAFSAHSSGVSSSMRSVHSWSQQPAPPGQEQQSVVTFYSGGGHDDSGIGDTDDTDVWAWAAQLDELSRSLRARLVFHNFVEAPLAFPCSYRWNRVPADAYLAGRYRPGRGGLAGDHADRARLHSAYSTLVPSKPGFFNRALSFARATSTLSAGSTTPTAAAAAGTASGASSPPPSPAVLGLTTSTSALGGGGGTPRTPSWTDRVLTHSLPGKAPLLRWRQYDLADDVGLSDHRPVAAHLTLLVDAEFAPPRGPNPSPGAGTGAGLALFFITIPKPPIVMLQGKGRGSGVMPAPPSSSEVSILFPLTGEDPIAEQRKASSLGEVMPGASTMPRSSSTSSLSHFTLAPASFPIRLRTVACPRRSEHLLLKINAGEKEVGQVCVPLALFLPTPTEPQEGGANTTALPPPAPAPLPTDPTVDTSLHPCEEVIEGTGTHAGKQLRGGRGGGLRFPLTSGGAFKGWVQLDMRVRVRPLEASSGV